MDYATCSAFESLNIGKKMVIAAEEQLSQVMAPVMKECDGEGCCAPVGVTAKRALLVANIEERVVVGLSDAIQALAKTPEEFLFCFMAPPKPGDSATHMHEVLLQAFCFEHDIYIIKVGFIILFTIQQPPPPKLLATFHLKLICIHLKQRHAFINSPTLSLSSLPKQIDSAEKLSRLLGSTTLQSCALVQKTMSADHQHEILSKVEDQLVDYCEEHWEDPVKPVVKLPEK